MANVIGDGILGTFKGEFSGSSYRTMSNKMMEAVSIKDFGAIGDGVANDTAAFQAMANYAAAQTALDKGTKIFIPPGSYIITNTINFMDVQKFQIFGAGPTASIIFPFFNGDVFRFRKTPGSSSQGYQLLDFQMKTIDPRTSGAGVNFEGTVSAPGYSDGFSDVTIEGMIFHSLHQAIYLYKTGTVKLSRCTFFNEIALAPISVPIVHSIMGIGLMIERCTQSLINSPGQFGLSSGFCLDTGCDTVFIDNNEMAGSLESGVHLRNTFLALAESGPRIVRVSNTSPELCTTANFLIDDCTGAHFEGVHANAGARGMLITGGKGINVVNSSFNLHDFGGIVVNAAGTFPLRSLQISDCKINKNGAGAAGIDITSNCPEDSTLISGCQIGNSDLWAGFVPQQYGIRLAAGAHHINAVANNLVGNPVAIQNDSTASTNNLSNNILPDIEANSLKIFYPSDYGAKGDGATDDTAAMQRCVNAAASVGGAADLANGNYRINTLDIPQGLLELRGPGGLADRAPTSGFDALVTLNGSVESGSFIDNLVVRNVTFFSDQSNTKGFIAGGYATRVIIEECVMSKLGVPALPFIAVWLANNSLGLNASNGCQVINNNFLLSGGTSTAVKIEGYMVNSFNDYFVAGTTPDPTSPAFSNSVRNNIIQGVSSGIVCMGATKGYILGNRITASAYGIDLNLTCIENTVSDNDVVAGTIPIRMQYGSKLNSVSNNRIVSRNGTEFAAISIDLGSFTNYVTDNFIQSISDYSIYMSTGSSTNTVTGNYLADYEKAAISLESDWVNTTIPGGAVYTTKIAGPPPTGLKWAFTDMQENVVQGNIVHTRSPPGPATMFSLTNIISQNGINSFGVFTTQMLDNILTPGGSFFVAHVIFCFENSPGTVANNSLKHTKTQDVGISKYSFSPALTSNLSIFEDNFGGQSKLSTFAANSATPSVGTGLVYFITANAVPTDITNFLDGYVLQNIVVQLDPNTTISESGSILLTNPGKLVGDFETYVAFRKQLNGVWAEQWRSTPRQYSFVTFADGDTTPSVAGNTNNTYLVSNSVPTTITDFDDAYDGQKITVLFDVNTGVAHNANISLSDSLTITPGSLDAQRYITFQNISSIWVEVSRSGLRTGAIVFAANDATPSVSRRMHPVVGEYATNNLVATNVTDFDDGQDTQEILLRLDSNTTIVHNAALIILKGAVNVTGVNSNNFIRLRQLAGIWYEQSRNF